MEDEPIDMIYRLESCPSTQEIDVEHTTVTTTVTAYSS